jgi:pimeloyl-ACP methyl ester carboxylesterase
VLLLSASHTWIATRPAERRDAPEHAIGFEAPAMADDGPVRGRTNRLSALTWSAAGGEARLPVVLIHGSPGSATNFKALGAAVAAEGRDVYALDLPGFGLSETWVPSYSILAHARATLAAMDALGIERAHLVSWSMGGGVILHAADLAPQRVASLSLVASIGVQEAEGSGNYFFEHFKYALNYALTVVLPEFLPHFGAFGPRAPRHAFARNFWDSDQRPLRPLMEGLETPALILQGRSDFLVPLWAAETSHELLRNSRLVILEGSHFLLFSEPGQLRATCDELLPFLARHDRAGRPEPRARVDRSVARAGIEPFLLPRLAPWWMQLLLLATAWWFLPEVAVIACGVLAGTLQLDLPGGLIGCALALSLYDFARSRRAGTGFPFLAWCCGLGWILILALLAAIAGRFLVARLTAPVGAWPAVLLSIAILCAILRGVQRLSARQSGRGFLIGRGHRFRTPLEPSG